MAESFRASVEIGVGRVDRPESTEAVRKPREFLQTIAQSEIFRDFFASKRSEGSKK
jgi:hypothetical protein